MIDYDVDTPVELFAECRVDKPIDEHWYLEPICQRTDVRPLGNYSDICGRPRSWYEHNEIVNPDADTAKHEFLAPTEPLVWGETAWRQNVCPGSKRQDLTRADTRDNTITCTCPCHWGSYYVNIYQLSRNYGGPEEGGWWYDSGSPVGAIPCESYTEAEEIAEKYEQRFPTTKARYSVLGGEDHTILIEREMGRYWPERTPRYE